MKPRRYLLVIDSLQCGGAERHVLDLGTELVARGNAVTVACSVGGHFASGARDAGVRVVELGDELVKRRFSPAFAAGVRELGRRGRFDLVHGHLYAGGLAAACASAGIRVPLVLTEQTEGAWRSPRQRLASRLAYAGAQRVIGVSTAITRDLACNLGVPPQKLRFVPNGVEIGSPDRVRSPGQAAPVVGLVARLQPEKDVPTFLRCAALLVNQFPNMTFRIAGDGPLRGELEALASELGIESHVSFLGVREDMDSFFSEIDVLACSSVAEGTPLAIAEAMGARVPVVATAVGGIPDQISDGRDGLLADAREPRQLAAQIARLVDDEAEARRIADNGHRRATAEFSVATMASRVQAIYKELLPADASERAADRASAGLEREAAVEAI